jgi:hypothetical protein
LKEEIRREKKTIVKTEEEKKADWLIDANNPTPISIQRVHVKWTIILTVTIWLSSTKD